MTFFPFFNPKKVDFFSYLPQDDGFLTTLGKATFENIVGKGENAGYQHFLLFPQCFLPYKKKFHNYSHI